MGQKIFRGTTDGGVAEFITVIGRRAGGGYRGTTDMAVRAPCGNRVWTDTEEELYLALNPTNRQLATLLKRLSEGEITMAQIKAANDNASGRYVTL